jgi:broad specificity phosphatase PhoE
MERRINERESFLEGLLPQDKEWDYNEWVRIYGTKWTDSGTRCSVNENGNGQAVLICGFSTAWAPPLEGVLSITEKWPTATFGISFAEQGMGIFGYFIASNGTVHIDADVNEPDCGDWTEDPDGAMDNYMAFEEDLNNMTSLATAVQHGWDAVELMKSLALD